MFKSEIATRPMTSIDWLEYFQERSLEMSPLALLPPSRRDQQPINSCTRTGTGRD